MTDCSGKLRAGRGRKSAPGVVKLVIDELNTMLVNLVMAEEREPDDVRAVARKIVRIVRNRARL